MAIQTINDLANLLQRVTAWIQQGQQIQADVNSALTALTGPQSATALAAQDIINQVTAKLTQMGITVTPPPA